MTTTPTTEHQQELRDAQQATLSDTLFVVESDGATIQLLGEICLLSGSFLHLSEGKWTPEIADQVTRQVHDAFHALAIRNPHHLTRERMIALSGHDADQFPPAHRPSGI